MVDKSELPIPGHPELFAERAAETEILAEGPSVQLGLLFCSNLVQQELTRLGISKVALLIKTVSVALGVMQAIHSIDR